MTVSETPSIERYRETHKIEPIPARGGRQVCAHDSIPVYRVLTQRFQHDPNVIRRLRNEEIRADLDRPYVSEVDGDGLSEAKRASEIAREDAFVHGRLTFEWRHHAVDLDLAE